MLVSWNWLSDYVRLDMPVEQLQTRLMMAGLNHEGTECVGEDLAIDLEVTSNRPDCLGHVGIAREIAVLWDQALRLPPVSPEVGPARVDDLANVKIECPELCSRYTARVIRGVRIGPSPKWLSDRLRTIGMATVNNVVDITNYVLMECGQPLHTFDFARLSEGRIVVRQSRPGEAFLAIDHKTYSLEPGMCVIASDARAVALGGVMGGAETEVSPATTDLLVESACFDPLSVRNTARRLNLHSPSSFRFERGVDWEGIDWASRRCCALILELAGGELAEDVIDVAVERVQPEPIVLRLSQLKRVLGIELDPAEVRRILRALGNRELCADSERLQVIPPSWRQDLTREIDLVEEVIRIHGYQQIAEDVGVPMVASRRSDRDRVLERVHRVLTAAGFSEAITLSAVELRDASIASPWCGAQSLRCVPPVLKGCDRLRQSLLPSLLGARHTNETLTNPVIELFEVAHVYLPEGQRLPRETKLVGLTSGRNFLAVKGVVQAVVRAVARNLPLSIAPLEHELLDPQRSGAWWIGDKLLGYVGELSPQGLARFLLRRPASVAEVSLSLLIDRAELVPRYQPLSPYPVITWDRNVVFEERVRWADIERIVRASGGKELEQVDYQETYRDEGRLGPGRKSVLLRITLRSHEGTLTREQVEEICQRIDSELRDQLGGELRAI